MNKTRKKHGRIRYGKLFLCLVILFIGVFFFVFGASKGYSLVSSVLSSTNKKPSYYLAGGINDSNQIASVFLIAVHSDNNQISILGIPPNTKISRNSDASILLKDTYPEGGVEETKSAIENMLHIRIDNYMIVSYDSFLETINHMEPVDLYVEKNMEHTDRNGDYDISLRQGYQTMTGPKALEYMRYLDASDGEILRIQRQERFIHAVIDKMRARPGILNWFMVRRYWNLENSDLSANKAAELAYHLGSIKDENIHYLILPGEQEQDKTHTLFWSINPVEVQRAIASTLVDGT